MQNICARAVRFYPMETWRWRPWRPPTRTLVPSREGLRKGVHFPSGEASHTVPATEKTRIWVTCGRHIPGSALVALHRATAPERPTIATDRACSARKNKGNVGGRHASSTPAKHGAGTRPECVTPAPQWCSVSGGAVTAPGASWLRRRKRGMSGPSFVGGSEDRLGSGACEVILRRNSKNRSRSRAHKPGA